jgi:hypothetical protein
MKQAPPVEPPVKIEKRTPLDPKLEPPLPIDISKSDCDDPVPRYCAHCLPEKPWPWTRQNAAIVISGFDGVTEDGTEIYNFCRAEGIKNLAIMGVHTNYCVTNRSFGIRQMVRLGMNMVLVRDLTDAMYDPRERPYVSQARGSELVVEHIERYLCPSILAEDLTHVAAGSAG